MSVEISREEIGKKGKGIKSLKICHLIICFFNSDIFTLQRLDAFTPNQQLRWQVVFWHCMRTVLVDCQLLWLMSLCILCITLITLTICLVFHHFTFLYWYLYICGSCSKLHSLLNLIPIPCFYRFFGGQCNIFCVCSVFH